MGIEGGGYRSDDRWRKKKTKLLRPEVWADAASGDESAETENRCRVRDGWAGCKCEADLRNSTVAKLVYKTLHTHRNSVRLFPKGTDQTAKDKRVDTRIIFVVD